MVPQEYSQWLRVTSLEVNSRLGKSVLTEDELRRAIPPRIYAELSEDGDLDKRTLVTKIPVDLFGYLYQNHAGFREAIKKIHARL